MASSAAAAFLKPATSVLAGLVAGVIVVYAIDQLEFRLAIDDPGGTISVHALAGIWGLIDKKQVNLVAAVAAMPEVAMVETTMTHEGVALVQAVNAAGPAPGALVRVQTA